MLLYLYICLHLFICLNVLKLKPPSRHPQSVHAHHLQDALCTHAHNRTHQCRSMPWTFDKTAFLQSLFCRIPITLTTVPQPLCDDASQRTATTVPQEVLLQLSTVLQQQTRSILPSEVTNPTQHTEEETLSVASDNST